MRSGSRILVYAAIILAFPAGCKKAGVFKKRAWSCDVKTALMLGRAYYLANPLSEPTKLAEYIRQNKAYFMKDGTAIRCAQELGSRLVAYAFSAFSQEDYTKGYESVLRLGATAEEARYVANSLNDNELDARMMGEELLWLAEVLPCAAEGDWGPFQTTGTIVRNHIRAIKPYLDTDPSARQTPDSRIAQFGPISEEQIVMLSIMFEICR